MYYVSLMNIIKPVKFTNVIAAVALSIDSPSCTWEWIIYLVQLNSLLNLINRINGNHNIKQQSSCNVKWLLLMKNASILTPM